jgi:plastocyanin
MKRLFILMVFLLVAATVTACGGRQASNESPVTQPAITVQITREYCPSIQAQAGTEIAWTNADDAEHVLLLERKDGQGNLIDSGGTDLLQPGSTFSITLMEAGEYTVYCSKDRSAFGTLTVSP